MQGVFLRHQHPTFRLRDAALKKKQTNFVIFPKLPRPPSHFGPPGSTFQIDIFYIIFLIIQHIVRNHLLLLLLYHYYWSLGLWMTCSRGSLMSQVLYLRVNGVTTDQEQFLSQDLFSTFNGVTGPSSSEIG